MNFDHLLGRRFRSRKPSVVVPLNAVRCVLTRTGPSGLDGRSETVLNKHRSPTSVDCRI